MPVALLHPRVHFRIGPLHPVPPGTHLAHHATSGPDTGFALALAVVVGVIYLVIVRLIDHNEKEPAWALGVSLVTGAVGALVLAAIVHAKTLHGTTVLASVADEVTIFVCLVLVVAGLEAIARLRGWSEINGPVDGLVYGAAVGLGFATGEAFVRELHINTALATINGTDSSLSILWTTLLAGLAGGLFGGVMGAAFGWAVDRGGLEWVALPVLGLGVAFGLQVGYLELAHGNALGTGTGARVREWVALGAPAAFFLVVIAAGLRWERSVIADELREDPVQVTPDELRMLTNPVTRRGAYLRRFATLDHHGWVGLRSLHNRLVQLALTKRRSERATDPASRAELEAEVAHLRTAVQAARDHLRAPSPPARPPVPQEQA